MKLLAIETSCDETAIAILEAEGGLIDPHFKVLANALVSQIDIHKEFGGVVPNLAKREHEKNLPVLLAKVLSEAGMDPDNPDIDYITVTSGPGLEPALWVGITFAEGLGQKWGKPVVPTNHMEGHIYSVLYRTESNPNDQSLISKQIQMPALALLVSGGHTELVYIKDYGTYEVLGRTRDDAVGEAFDKVARMLELPYPGGPEISKLAKIHREKEAEPEIKFPMPMIHSKNLDFSFSGLKTSVLYKLRSISPIDENAKQEIAHAFEDAAIGTLIAKTEHALNEYTEINTLIVGGGVAANNYLKSELEKLVSSYPQIKLWMPERSVATDNAVMIGITAYINVTKNPSLLKEKLPLRANGNLSL